MTNLPSEYSDFKKWSNDFFDGRAEIESFSKEKTTTTFRDVNLNDDWIDYYYSGAIILRGSEKFVPIGTSPRFFLIFEEGITKIFRIVSSIVYPQDSVIYINANLEILKNHCLRSRGEKRFDKRNYDEYDPVVIKENSCSLFNLSEKVIISRIHDPESIINLPILTNKLKMSMLEKKSVHHH